MIADIRVYVYKPYTYIGTCVYGYLCVLISMRRRFFILYLLAAPLDQYLSQLLCGNGNFYIHMPTVPLVTIPQSDLLLVEMALGVLCGDSCTIFTLPETVF